MKIALIYGLLGLFILIESFNKLILEFPFTPVFFLGIWLFFDSLDTSLRKTSTITKMRKGNYKQFLLIFI